MRFIKYSYGSSFTMSFLIGGCGLIVLGLILLGSTLFGLAIVGLGFYLAFTFEGIKFDVVKKSFSLYSRYCGLDFDNWASMDNYNEITRCAFRKKRIKVALNT